MNVERWLRLYPAAWRERYGTELADLLADCAAAGRLSRRDRFDLLVGGLRERGRAATGAGAAERARAGVLWVLASWAAFLVAGGVLAKSSEHWQQQAPLPRAGFAEIAFDVLRGSAALGGAAVLVGVGVAVPALRVFLRSGGWPALLRIARPAAGLTVVTAAASVGLVAWAHGLPEAARNGGDPAYGAAFLCWGALVVACLGASTVAGIRTARMLTFSRAALRSLAASSAVVAAAIVVAAAATVGWRVAWSPPWVLDGSMALMLLAGLGATAGARLAWRASAQPLVNFTV